MAPEMERIEKELLALFNQHPTNVALKMCRERLGSRLALFDKTLAAKIQSKSLHNAIGDAIRSVTR